MAPLLLKVKGNKSFSPFSNLTDEDSLTRTWRVCTKVAAHLEQGQRLENLSWRLWYLHDLIVENNDNKSKRDFKRLSKATGEKLDKDKGRSIEQLIAPGFRRTDSGEALRKKAAERQKLRALAVAKLQGKFKAKHTMQHMQYTFALNPNINFKSNPLAVKKEDVLANHASSSPTANPTRFFTNSCSSSPVECFHSSALDAHVLQSHTPCQASVNVKPRFSPTQTNQSFLSAQTPSMSMPPPTDFKLEDIEAMERELLSNQHLDLNAPLDSLLAGLGRMEDVQMDLADLGLPNFNAPFDPSSFINFSQPLIPTAPSLSTSSNGGPTHQVAGPAKQKAIKKRKTDPHEKKLVAELVRKKSQELRAAAHQLTEPALTTTTTTHLSSASSTLVQPPGSSTAGAPSIQANTTAQWGRQGQASTPVTPSTPNPQHPWIASAPNMFGTFDHNTFSQALGITTSLHQFQHPPIGFDNSNDNDNDNDSNSNSSENSSESNNNSMIQSSSEPSLALHSAANTTPATVGGNQPPVPLHIDTSVAVERAQPSYFARGTSVSTPSTPLIADVKPLSQSNKSIDSVSAPTSPTIRPSLANLGRSGSSPGPSNHVKRHSADGDLPSDPAPKARGRGRRSLAGLNAFTAIHPNLDKKPYLTESTSPAAQCTNCGATSTPLWRRDPNDLLLCNACGLYLKLHKAPRPRTLKNNHSHVYLGHTTPSATPGGASAPNSRNVSPSRAGSPNAEDMICCNNCGTYTTPLWRKDDAGHTVCNACGLYLKLHNEHRPAAMRADVIKKRSRYDEKRGRASAVPSRKGSPQPCAGPTVPCLNNNNHNHRAGYHPNNIQDSWHSTRSDAADGIQIQMRAKAETDHGRLVAAETDQARLVAVATNLGIGTSQPRQSTGIAIPFQPPKAGSSSLTTHLSTAPTTVCLAAREAVPTPSWTNGDFDATTSSSQPGSDSQNAFAAAMSQFGLNLAAPPVLSSSSSSSSLASIPGSTAPSSFPSFNPADAWATPTFQPVMQGRLHPTDTTSTTADRTSGSTLSNVTGVVSPLSSPISVTSHQSAETPNTATSLSVSTTDKMNAMSSGPVPSRLTAAILANNPAIAYAAPPSSDCFMTAAAGDSDNSFASAPLLLHQDDKDQQASAMPCQNQVVDVSVTTPQPASWW